MGERSGPRLRYARDANGRITGTENIGLDPEPFTRPLTCPDPACAVPVVPVREHARTGENGTPATVIAHFRLAPAAHHRPGCRYDPDQVLAAIAADSHGAAKASTGRLRLTIPADFADPMRTAPAPHPTAGRRSALTTTSTRPALAPAIGSAAAIQRFLNRYPDDPDALTLFHVDYAGRRIPWPQFSLGADPKTLRELADQLAHGHASEHPIAIHGTITATGTSRTATSVYAEQDLRTKILLENRPRWLYIRLRTRDQRLIESFTPGRRFLAIGSWDFFAADNARTAELVLWIRKPWQLTAWDSERSAT